MIRNQSRNALSLQSKPIRQNELFGLMALKGSLFLSKNLVEKFMA